MKEMTVGENIMLGQEPESRGLIRQKELHEKAEEILKEDVYKRQGHGGADASASQND